MSLSRAGLQAVFDKAAVYTHHRSARREHEGGSHGAGPSLQHLDSQVNNGDAHRDPRDDYVAFLIPPAPPHVRPCLRSAIGDCSTSDRRKQRSENPRKGERSN